MANIVADVGGKGYNLTMVYDGFKKIEIIGVPSDLGTHIRGTNIGPACIRIAGLKKGIATIGYEVSDYGDVVVPIRESLSQKSRDNFFVEEISDICWQLFHIVQGTLTAGKIPVVLGGDHSLAIGSISGAISFFAKNNQRLGLIWIDAHADLNSQKTSETGNIHGMPLATLIGKGDDRLMPKTTDTSCLHPHNIALVGIRALDCVEREICKSCGIRYFTMRDIDERGISQIMHDAVAIASDNTEGIAVSFDLDAIDPTQAPGVSTPAMGGLTCREARLALELINQSNLLCSFDLVELNPIRDTANKSANLATELVQAVLGQTIL